HTTLYRLFLHRPAPPLHLPSFPTRRSSDLVRRRHHVWPSGVHLRVDGERRRVHRVLALHHVAVVVDEEEVRGADVPEVHPERVEDRKSTRLNSSHVAISYAVFCLKKKKKEE